MDVFTLISIQYIGNGGPCVNTVLTYFTQYDHALRYASKMAEEHGGVLEIHRTDVWEEGERGIDRSYYQVHDRMFIQIERQSMFDGDYE